MPDKNRCFIALDLPKEIVSELRKVQNELEKHNLFIGKFTEEENIHLTLKFLGSISSEVVTRIKQQLKRIKVNSFEASVDEVGIFSEEFVRIIWARLNGNEVHELQKKIDDSIVDFFPREERFMGHITIARVKSLKEKQPLFDALRKVNINTKGRITSFSLMKSTLKPEGAIHEVIEKYVLG